MIRWRWGTVVAPRTAWHGSVEVQVAVEARRPTTGAGCAALAYPALVGRPGLGDRVLLNVNALALGLGTGGYALVVAIPDRLPEMSTFPVTWSRRGTRPLQAVVLAADEEARRCAAAGRHRTSPGMPVVVADLHSALPASSPACAGPAGRERSPT